MSDRIRVSRRTVTVWLFISFLILVPETVLVVSALDNRAPCVIAQEWVSRHSSSLPSSLDGIVAYPLVYRRAIYARLGDKVRATLWIEQLSTALNERTSLSSAQRNYIRRVVAYLSKHGMPAKNSDTILALGRDAQRLFGHTSDSKLFTQLGVDDEGRYSRGVSSAWLTLQGAVRRSLVAEAQQAICQCATYDYSDFCNLWHDPDGGGPGYAWCEDYEWYGVPHPCYHYDGCGFLAQSQCNGTCGTAIPCPPGQVEEWCFGWVN